MSYIMIQIRVDVHSNVLLLGYNLNNMWLHMYVINALRGPCFFGQ